MTQETKSARRREWLRWLPGIGISLVALFVVFRLARWEGLSTAFTTIQWEYIWLSGLFTVAFLLVRAAAWRTLMENKPSFKDTFFVVNEGYLLNNLFPLRAGEIGRAVIMGQQTGWGPFHVLSTIVIERVFDMLMAAGMLLATLPLVLGAVSWGLPVAIITLIVMGGGLVVMFLMARNRDFVERLATRLGERWPFVKTRVVPQVEKMLDGLSALSNPRQFLTALGLIMLCWFIAVFQYYVVMIPIAPGSPLWYGAFIVTVLALGVAIPSAPAALGVFEASIVGAMAILGFDNATALAIGISLHFMQFVITGIFGIIGLVIQRRSLGSLFSETRLQKEAQ
ncbi:MAG: flippase-like domain-containing protein [Chloroflexi bacterium]|nr:flippase-like domain-containing protein [Chloroflexota bacterium]